MNNNNESSPPLLVVLCDIYDKGNFTETVSKIYKDATTGMGMKKTIRKKKYDSNFDHGDNGEEKAYKLTCRHKGDSFELCMSLLPCEAIRKILANGYSDCLEYFECRNFNKIRLTREYFPLRELEKLKAVTFDYCYCDLENEDCGDMDLFHDCETLEELKIHNTGNLAAIPSAFFKGCVNLKSVSLVKTRIDARTVPENLFQDAKQLEEVRFVDNYMVNILPRDLLANHDDLQRLTIQDQKLSPHGIPSGFLDGCSRLTTIVLSGLGIAHVPENLFRDCGAHLKHLSLASNSIEELPKGVFAAAKNLTVLSLWGNEIKKMDDDTFAENVLLEQLDCGCNPLEAIPASLYASSCHKSLQRFNFRRELMEKKEFTMLPPHVQKYFEIRNPDTNHSIYFRRARNAEDEIVKSTGKQSYKNFAQTYRDSRCFDELVDFFAGNGRRNDKKIKNWQRHVSEKSFAVIAKIYHQRGKKFDKIFGLLSAMINFVEKEQQILFDGREIYKLINEEIEEDEFEKTCTTGQLMRLINCLSGFTDQVQIRVPEADQIYFISVNARYQHYGDVAKQKKHFVKTMKEEYGYSDKTIDHWLLGWQTEEEKQ